MIKLCATIISLWHAIWIIIATIIMGFFICLLCIGLYLNKKENEQYNLKNNKREEM